MDISVVIPVFNEEEALPYLRQAAKKFFSTFLISHEMILINDASTDRSMDILQDWHAEDACIRVIHLSTNVGHQKAILEGMRAANGKYIVTMDADLQDPLEEIPHMIQKAKEGYEIVHMQRISREGESTFRKVSAWTYYRVAKLLDSKLLLDVGDFRLMSKNTFDHFFKDVFESILIRRVAPQLQVLQTTIQYRRKKRIAGKSKFSFTKLVELAFLPGLKQKK